MPVYPCPECGAQLRPANPVPAGKKLRCPKCEAVFAVKGAEAPSAKKAPTPAPAAKKDDDDEVGQYGMLEEKDERTAEERAKSAFDPIKNRFKLSARGPALTQVVRPSTWLLATGVLICIFAVTGALYSVWPMIFKIEIVQPDDPQAKWRPQSSDSGRKFKELSPDEYKERWLFFGGFVFQFLWGAVVCAGASKMHTLESYALAMIGSIMAIIGPGVPLAIWLFTAQDAESYTIFLGVLAAALPGVPVSIWCISTLRNKKVIAGFAEEKPDEA